MKTHSNRSLGLIAALFCMAVPPLLHADTDSPMFAGTSLWMQGDTYNWLEASEDGTFHYDTYQGSSGQTVTAMGLIGLPNLASVSGNGMMGYLQYGSYGDCAIYGSDTGSWNYHGYNYDQYSYGTYYIVDLWNGTLSSSSSSTYSSPTGSYQESSDGYGNYNWSQSDNGTAMSNGPFTGQSYLDLFGNSFTHYQGSYSWSYYAYGDYSSAYGSSTTNYFDHYTAADGSTLYLTYFVTYDANGGYSNEGTGVSGWDAYLGSYSAYYGSGFSGFAYMNWDGRTAPTFAPSQLWVDGALVNWAYGQINSDGNITDSYMDSSGTEVLSISGNGRQFLSDSSSPAYVQINSSGITGSFTSSSGITAGSYSGIVDIETSPPTTIYYSSFFGGFSSLWVNGIEYPFVQGVGDTAGSRADTYSNPSFGSLVVSGNESDPNSASIYVTYGSGSDYGYYYGGGNFYTYSIAISPSPPFQPYGQDAYWVRGRFYTRVTDSNNFQTASPGSGSLSLGSAGDGTDITFSGSDSQGSFSGTVSAGQTGAFPIQDESGNSIVIVVPANTDGSLQLSSQLPVEGLPPAVMVSGTIWQFWGMLTLNGTSTAVYGNAVNATDTGAGAGQILLVDFSGNASLTDYFAGTNAAGTYSFSTHLFQAGTPGDGFPMPIYGVDPSNNNTLWNLANPSDGPLTFLVGGAVWRYAGTDGNGRSQYQGYYAGQLLTLGLPGSDSAEGRSITVVDPTQDTTLQGTLSSVRGSAQMSDGSMVYSGDFTGQQINPTLDSTKVHTIAADLDITGNVITFGALTGNAATAAVTLQFQDLDNGSGSLTASMNSILARPQAQWLWSRTTSSSAQPTLPVMKLDASSKLSLYDPADPTTATVKLSPQTDQISELPKLKLNHQTLDDTDATRTHVLTRSLADNRYLRTSGSGQNLALNGSINVNTGTNSTTNTLPGDGKAAAIGQNLQAGSGQVVVGKYNTGTPSSDVFVVGAGSSSTKKDALTVSSSGNTVVNGDLSVTGTTAMANATVSGSLSVAGRTVLTQGTGSSAYLTSGQITTDYYRKDASAYNFGTGSWAGNSGSMALGPQALAKGGEDPSFAMGRGAVAGISSTEVGITLPNGLVAGEGGGATAIGLGAYATYYAIALGNYSRATGGSTALGIGSNALAWNSVALGGGQAEGPGSLALGSRSFTSASADSSAAIGFNVFASGARAMALGTDSNAIGFHSMALNGAWARAENSVGIGPSVHTFYPDEVVVGTYPEAPIFGVVTERQPTDPLFVVGNGSGTGPMPNSNALVVQRNGDVKVSGALTVAGSPVITQAAAATTYATQASLDSTNTTVSNLNTTLTNNYVSKPVGELAMGFGATTNSGGWAFGYNSIAGVNSISLGTWAGSNGTPASGGNSVSIGYAARSPGVRSYAIGGYTWAGGDDSIAYGSGALTRSKNAVAIGNGSVGAKPGQVAVGAYNTLDDENAPDMYNQTSASDNIFIIGNGTSDTQRSNAFLIKRNGDAHILGGLTVDGVLTINGQSVLTQAEATGFATQAALTALSTTLTGSYLTAQTAAATYALQTAISDLLSKTEASNTYLAKGDAFTTYLAKGDAATTYLAKADAMTTYLKINDAQTDYYRVNQPLVVPNTTTLNGSLTATQASRFQASFVVEGQKENPADPANRKVIAKPDQEVLVPEQGDISMGEFRAGNLPVSQ